MGEQIDRVKNYKQFIKEEYDEENEHYRMLLHGGTGNFVGGRFLYVTDELDEALHYARLGGGNVYKLRDEYNYIVDWAMGQGEGMISQEKLIESGGFDNVFELFIDPKGEENLEYGSYRLKNKLKNKLLYFGGDNVELGLDTDEELGRMLNDGVLFHVDVVNLRGRFGQCHRNVADKYKRFSSGGFKIVTGYALGNGIWFQHSWGLGSTGKIMETTGNKYDMYYGYVLNQEESHEFCFSNY